ncbi:hypothetical protein ACQ4PT_007471 [Festuca glaucescens]
MASAHVVVIAFPFSSHTVMFLRLARALAAAAPAATVTFVSTATSLARLHTAGALQGNLRFVEIPESGATGEMAAVPHLARVLLFMASAEAGGLRDALEAARVSAGGAKVNCVVADAFMWIFGTIVAAGPEELRELAAGLEAAGAPFLWSLRAESWPHLPPGFMERGAGIVVPWVPQVQVLGHASVGAFVTHAGWASVLEGVSAGVPMACRPVLSDQRTNARSVHLWGFGTTIDEPVTRAGVAAAVSSLLNADEEARMWARMQELRGKVASAFAPGGGSRNNFDKLVKIVCALSP